MMKLSYQMKLIMLYAGMLMMKIKLNSIKFTDIFEKDQKEQVTRESGGILDYFFIISIIFIIKVYSQHM